MFSPNEKSNQMFTGEAECHDHHYRDNCPDLCFTTFTNTSLFLQTKPSLQYPCLSSYIGNDSEPFYTAHLTTNYQIRVRLHRLHPKCTKLRRKMVANDGYYRSLYLANKVTCIESFGFSPQNF